MKTVTILRGLPGSGKSTLARKLADETGAVICSADDWMVDGSGRYHFDPRRLGDVHAQCQEKARAALGAGASVIIDNTNIKRRDFAPYLEMAREFGAVMEVLCPTTPWAFDPLLCSDKTVHNVPAQIIVRMLSDWEYASQEDEIHA